MDPVRRALVFDIDNTLTPPRRPLTAEMAAALRSLTHPFHVAAGSDFPLVKEQFLDPLFSFGFRGQLDAFLCNGSTRYRCRFGSTLGIELLRDFSFSEHLGAAAFGHVIDLVNDILDREEFALPSGVSVIGNRIIDRRSMINVVPIGRSTGLPSAVEYRNRALFVEHDLRSGFRQRMLICLRRELSDLARSKALIITLGGQTSFDLVIEGNDKSYAVSTLLAEGYGELLYVGDALTPDGNDGAILSFIASWNGHGPCPVRAIPVANWQETMQRLRSLGAVLDASATT
jgi:phosphomannomutase